MQILNPGNKLESYTIKIDDVEIFPHMLKSLEMSYSNNTPVIKGRLIFDDLFDINRIVDIYKAKFEVIFTDIFGVVVEKEFVLINAKEEFKKDKIVMLEIQDKFSHILKESFMTKSYPKDSDFKTALLEFVDKLELSDFEIIFSEKEFPKSEGFVVPRNISNLDFFINMFYHDGFYFYQDKESVKVIHHTDLSIDKLPNNDDEHVYTDQHLNQYYKTKIIDLDISYYNQHKILPKVTSFAYDPLTKSVQKTDNNDKSPYFTGDNTEIEQHDFGRMSIFQHHLNFDNHDILMRDSYFEQSQIDIIVNGYCSNDLYQIYDVQLKGIRGAQESQDKGNQLLNGKYISLGITDKIIGDSMIQKIKLRRANENKGK